MLAPKSSGRNQGRAPDQKKSFQKWPGLGVFGWQRFWWRELIWDNKRRADTAPVSGTKASLFGSGQEVCFCPSRPDPGRNAREQDGTRTGRDGPHLGTWMGPKHCKTKRMANLDGTTSDPGWDLDPPRRGPRRGSGWHPPETVTDFQAFLSSFSCGNPCPNPCRNIKNPQRALAPSVLACSGIVL